jgi:hypothetical protein
MQIIYSESELTAAITQMETMHREETRLLKEEVRNSIEEIQPFTIIKNTLSKLVGSQGVKTDLLKISASVAAGYVSKSILIPSQTTVFKKILRTGVLLGVTALVTKNPGVLKTIGQAAMHRIRSKKDPETDHQHTA